MDTPSPSCPACGPLQDNPIWHPLCWTAAVDAGPPTVAEVAGITRELIEVINDPTSDVDAFMARKHAVVARIVAAGVVAAEPPLAVA